MAIVVWILTLHGTEGKALGRSVNEHCGIDARLKLRPSATWCGSERVSLGA